MPRHLSIDIETFSGVDLSKCGAYRYAQSPEATTGNARPQTFEAHLSPLARRSSSPEATTGNAQAHCLLLLAWAWHDEDAVRIVDLASGERIPEELAAALGAPDVVKHAYNAAFEWLCLNRAGYATPAEQWRCTMFHALYCGYGGSLAAVGEAMGLPQDRRKLAEGATLIRTFCTPRGAEGLRTLPQDEPQKWAQFREYCRRDVVAERDIERRLAPWPIPEAEQRLWALDTRINARGVAVDAPLIAGALRIHAEAHTELMEEARRLSGLNNPNSREQLKAWLEVQLQEELPDVGSETICAILDRDGGNAAVRRMCELRRELGRTSVSKYAAMRDCMGDDGRIRGLFQFYGANRTGRWAGRLVQVHNLPRNHLDTLQDARQLVREGDLQGIRRAYGNVADTLSQLIRTSFIPAPAHEFLIADFSAIEARILAWLAGERWVLDVFRGHGRIYEATASQMFGVPLERIQRGNPEYELRQRGKVATLALGYQGGPGALVQMGALRQGLTEAELPDIVRRWRAANPRIAALWHAAQAAAISCLRTGLPQTLAQDIRFACEAHGQTGQSFLTIALPSGRKLFYARPRLIQGPYGPGIQHMGMDQTTRKWGPVDTYGGKLVENIAQAVARDCLALTMERLEAAGLVRGSASCSPMRPGYQIVMHIHDEIVIEAPVGTPLEPVLEIMGRDVPWAPGLPLRADGFRGAFYRKE